MITEISKNKFLEKLKKYNLKCLTDINTIKKETYIQLEHLDCGTEFSTKFCNFMRKGKESCCPKCWRKKKSSDSVFREKIIEKFGNEYSILSEYFGKDKKILVRHNTCGYEFEIIAGSLLRKKPNSHCLYCAHSNPNYPDSRRKRTTEEFKLLVDNLVRR